MRTQSARTPQAPSAAHAGMATWEMGLTVLVSCGQYHTEDLKYNSNLCTRTLAPVDIGHEVADSFESVRSDL